MKIAILGTAYPYRGGIAAYNERLATEFLNQGHEVVIYTFSFLYPNFLFPGKTQYAEGPAPKGLSIERGIHALNPFNWIKIRRQIRRSNYDLVIPCFWLPLIAPCFGTILRGIKRPKVCIVHNMLPHEKRPFDGLLSKYFIKSNDAFLSMTEKVNNDVKLFDALKPKAVSPHPIYDSFGVQRTREESLAFLNLDGSVKYLLFFGLIRKYKGLDLLLKAFEDQRLKELNLKIIIAGEFYDDKSEYDNLISKYGLQDKIIQTDQYIPDSEVGYYFGAADMVVQPYKTATQSGVTQIAYHFNTPMIVTDVGGLKEMCPNEKVGFVVAPKEQEIADAIVRFYSEDWKERMQQGIAEEKKRFSWQVLTENIFALLNKV